MPETTPQVDHKAEASRRINTAYDLGANNADDGAIPILLAEAQVHSNLAIAEGQERVAEEIKLLRGRLDANSFEGAFIVREAGPRHGR